jgi:hypothetical protein
MTDPELFGTFFGFERDENGWPKLTDPLANRRPPSDESLYREYLRLSGITDRAKQDTMWQAERARRDRANRQSAGRRPRAAPASRRGPDDGGAAVGKGDD